MKLNINKNIEETQQFAFVTQCRVATHHLGNPDLVD